MTTCSAVRAQVGEALAGTSPSARLWVLLEQPGAWGRDALTESHLPVEVGRALAALAADRPVRFGLIRSVGAHVDTGGAERTLLVARTDAHGSWLAARRLTDIDTLPQLLSIDALLSASAPPADLPGRTLPTPEHALLVCTNAKRDQCCAVLGRPLAASMAQDAGSDTQVWETSHTGGHRFAPTFVSLPDGYLYGGPTAATRSLDACRGRSSLAPAAQVAELYVLRQLGVDVPRPLEVQPERAETPEVSTWRVRADADVFTVEVTRNRGVDRPESCGKGPVVQYVWSATLT